MTGGISWAGGGECTRIHCHFYVLVPSCKGASYLHLKKYQPYRLLSTLVHCSSTRTTSSDPHWAIRISELSSLWALLEVGSFCKLQPANVLQWPKHSTGLHLVPPSCLLSNSGNYTANLLFMTWGWQKTLHWRTYVAVHIASESFKPLAYVAVCLDRLVVASQGPLLAAIVIQYWITRESLKDLMCLGMTWYQLGIMQRRTWQLFNPLWLQNLLAMRLSA